MIVRKFLLYRQEDIALIGIWAAGTKPYIAVHTAKGGKRLLLGASDKIEEFDWHRNHFDAITIYGRDGEGNVVPVIQGAEATKNGTTKV